MALVKSLERRMAQYCDVSLLSRQLLSLGWPLVAAACGVGAAMGAAAVLPGPGSNLHRLEIVLAGGTVAAVTLVFMPVGMSLGAVLFLASLRLHLWSEYITVSPFVCGYVVLLSWIRKGRMPRLDAVSRLWLGFLAILAVALAHQVLWLNTPTYIAGFGATASGCWFLFVISTAIAFSIAVREEIVSGGRYLWWALCAIVLMNGLLIDGSALGIHIHWYFLTGAAAQHGRRYGGTIEDYELAPEVMLVSCVALCVLGRPYVNRWLVYLSAMLGGVSVFLSGSRGPIIAFGLAFAVWAVLSRFWWVFAVAAVGVVAFASRLARTVVGSRLARTHLVYGVVPGDRLAVWRNVLIAIGRSPFIGYGPIVTKYVQGFSQPHSLYLHLLYWGGPLALVVFVAALISVALRVWRSNLSRVARSSLVAAVVFLAADELIIAMLRNEAATLLLFAVFGVFVGVSSGGYGMVARSASGRRSYRPWR